MHIYPSNKHCAFARAVTGTGPRMTDSGWLKLTRKRPKTHIGSIPYCVLLVVMTAGHLSWGAEVAAKSAAAQIIEVCSRPSQGGALADPPELRSRNGRLELSLKIR